MNNELFEKYISEAIVAVPKHLRAKIKNLAFVVEEEIRPARARERKIRMHSLLLGLYEGVPLPRRSGYYSGVLPDKITIFKKPIIQLAGPDEENIRGLVHEVVHHEIAHYFGMNETKVRNWEKTRHKRRTE